MSRSIGSVEPQCRIRVLDNRAGEPLRMSELEGPALQRHVSGGKGDGPDQDPERRDRSRSWPTNRGETRRHRRRIADEEFVLVLHAVRASTRAAGSTRVPGACGCGCTRTRPATTRTSNVGTFSVNGGGDAPVAGTYSYPCHGHTTQPLTIRPSPSGPF